MLNVAVVGAEFALESVTDNPSVSDGIVTFPAASLRTTLISDPRVEVVVCVGFTEDKTTLAGAPAVVIVQTADLLPAT